MKGLLINWFLQFKLKFVFLLVSAVLSAHPAPIPTPAPTPKSTSAHALVSTSSPKPKIKTVIKPSLKVSTPAPVTFSSLCKQSEADMPANINMDIVRSTWLAWTNAARSENGLNPYSYDAALNRTSTIWAQYSKNRGYINHKRPTQAAYYDYKIIEAWFKNLGVEFKNVNRITFSESINWGIYQCSESDCTDTFIKSMRTGFDFFMSEKGKKYKPHYDSIMNSEFQKIGLGIAIDKASDKYYLTVHYGTEITSGAAKQCN